MKTPVMFHHSFRAFVPLALAALLLLTGCANKKRLMSDADTASSGENASAKAVMSRLAQTEVPYKWFAGYGSGKIDWDGERFSASFKVRILRDSVIWLQIQKLGFEVGRMYITRDTAIVINRWERFYSIYSTREFCREYNLPADFDMFTKVFTAGAYVPDQVKTAMTAADGALHVSDGNGLSATYWFDPGKTLARSVVQDPFHREWFSVYDDYREVGNGKRFPFRRSNSVTIEGVASIMDLEYKGVELDVPQELPFSIPSNYEKI
jgi:hypothetical protein